MFLYQLNMMEKLAFMQLAKEMATVDDGKVDQQEFHLLSVMSNEMQVSVDNALSIEFDIECLAEKFTTKKSKNICIAELYSIATSNQSVHEKQSNLLNALVARFKIDQSEFELIKSWVEKAMNISNEGTKLLLQGEM